MTAIVATAEGRGGRQGKHAADHDAERERDTPGPSSSCRRRGWGGAGGGGWGNRGEGGGWWGEGVVREKRQSDTEHEARVRKSDGGLCIVSCEDGNTRLTDRQTWRSYYCQ